MVPTRIRTLSNCNASTFGRLIVSVANDPSAKIGEWISATVRRIYPTIRHDKGLRTKEVSLNTAGIGSILLVPGVYKFELKKTGKWTGVIWRKLVVVRIKAGQSEALSFEGSTRVSNFCHQSWQE